MIVRTLIKFAVFSTMEESDEYRRDCFSQSFHEFLKFMDRETATRRKVLRIVSKSYEGIIFVAIGFVDAPYCPLARAFQTTAYTLATGHLNTDSRR